MTSDPEAERRSVSPESSGRDSPILGQWKSRLAEIDPPLKDKVYRRYAAGVEKALTLFETALEEWADYISFLNRLLKAIQARPASVPVIPSKALVAKRLAQCLDPSLPSGVHQKTLEVYSYVFTAIGKDGLSRDLPLYLPGLAPTLSFAALSVREPYLKLLEQHFLALDPKSLRPAMKSVILALLPGLEDETSEDFDRTLRLVARFKESIRPVGSELLTDHHSIEDSFFWQSFFLATVTSSNRRAGALAYLIRYLPNLGGGISKGGQPDSKNGATSRLKEGLASVVTSPEPGLLVRCFVSGLSDEQLLIQRGFLDLLVTHMPLDSTVLQTRVKPADLDLLLNAAISVVLRREMSLNRRLWSWLLGPEPSNQDGDPAVESPTAVSHQAQHAASSKTAYFESYGLQPLTNALLAMIKDANEGTSSERTRPYRICLSLMDRWEIGGLVVPEVFLPVIQNVQAVKNESSAKADFSEVLRSASVFFDGIESGLIYGEMIGLLAQAISPSSMAVEERREKMALVAFILSNFNVREEEMVTVHAPLTCIAVLSMLQDANERRAGSKSPSNWTAQLEEEVLDIALSLLELIPERAFSKTRVTEEKAGQRGGVPVITNSEILKSIRNLYVNEQGNIDAASPLIPPSAYGELILQKAASFIRQDGGDKARSDSLGARVRILSLSLLKVPSSVDFESQGLMHFLNEKLKAQTKLPFPYFSSIVQLCTHLDSVERISSAELSAIIPHLVRHAWSYLNPAEPKYHVETVRCLWQLQKSLTLLNRDLEAAISAIIVTSCADSFSELSSEAGRTFGVLWSQTLQDSSSERRGLKTPVVEYRAGPRLAGSDNYDVMLTQPLFLMLDSLSDERTQLHMTVKSWLNTMIGIDRLFLVLVMRMLDVPFLQAIKTQSKAEEKAGPEVPSVSAISEDDDLDLCLYYLRTLHHVLAYSGEVSWSVMASKHLSFELGQVQISTGGEEGDMTIQDFFVRVCVNCITGDVPTPASPELQERASQLQRFALMVLHRFFLSQHAVPLADHHLEHLLIDRLARSTRGSDPYTQVLLLDVVHDSLHLRDTAPVERPTSPITEKREGILDPARSSRVSLTLSDARPAPNPPPASLLKCFQAGLSSQNSRPVLDSWVAFLGQCLPFYADTIFQILIPLVETLCQQIGIAFGRLHDTFRTASPWRDSDKAVAASESALLYLLNGLEQVLARAHDQLIIEESRAQLVKSPDQPHSIFGSMVSGVFQSDNPHSRSATANDRLTVHLALQDAVRMCYRIWSWGQGDELSKQDPTSTASFNYTSLRMRNRARRLLEHLFTAESLECLETIIDTWKTAASVNEHNHVFNFLSSLDASRPKYSIPALFNAIYSRTNPSALDPSRKSTLTIHLQDTDVAVFLVEYARSLDDDAMDEIWQECILFLKDLLSNPFPHRQTLPSLLEFAAILGAKVDNTNFGEQRRMRRELGDLFLRLLAAVFTTRPISFTEQTASGTDKSTADRSSADDVISILARIVPDLPKILLEQDRVLNAAGTISTNAIVPTYKSKIFPGTVSTSTMALLQELSRLQGNNKTWKKDVGEIFNDSRYFGMSTSLVKKDWLPLLRQWSLADKEKLSEIVGRINAPTTAGIVFGVGATSARLEADRKTQLNLRRIATLILAAADDAFVAALPMVLEKAVELLGATATSSPSSNTRADIYLLIRAIVLKTSSIHLSPLWPVINTEMHAAISSILAPDHSAVSDVYNCAGILQACKLLDLLICVAPDDFQLYEWLFVTDTIDAIYRSPSYPPVAIIDELSEELGNTNTNNSSLSAGTGHHENLIAAHVGANSSRRRPLLSSGLLNTDVSLERKDELVAKVLRPFFSQLSIYAFETTYAMGSLDLDACIQGLLDDLFDESTIVKAL